MDQNEIQAEEIMKDSLQKLREITGVVERKLGEKYGDACKARKIRINESDQSVSWIISPEKDPGLLFHAAVSEKEGLSDTYVSRKMMKTLEEQIAFVLGKAGLRTLIRALPDSEEGVPGDLQLPLDEYLSVRRVKWIHLAAVIETGDEPVEQAVPVLKQLCESLGTEITADLRGCSTENFEAYRIIFEKNINITTSLLDRHETANRFLGKIVELSQINKESI